MLNDPLALTIEDLAPQGEQRVVSIGTNVFGNLRVVVYALRGEECTNHLREQTGAEGSPDL